MPAAANTRRSAKLQANKSLQPELLPSASSSKDRMGPRAKRSRGFEPEASNPSEAIKDQTAEIQAVHAISQTVEDLRDIITCKICFRMLYAPFTAQCGHTFCYSCLCSWLTDHGTRKTCPDCRSPITTQPSPSYIIREMTQRIISHPELLPEGETVEKHLQQSQEEARLVERHKADSDPQTGGLFKGIFKKSLRLASQLQTGIRDDSDNVTRCPECLWQLEDGTCVHCGWGDEDYEDYDDDESLGSSDEDSEEESEYHFATSDAAGRMRQNVPDEEVDDDFYDAEADASLRALLDPDDAQMHGNDYSEDSDNGPSDILLQRALRESRRLAGIPSSPGGSNGQSSGGDFRSVSARSYDSYDSYDSEEDEDMDSFIDDDPIEQDPIEGGDDHSDYESTNEGNTTPRQTGSSESHSQPQVPAERQSQPQSSSSTQGAGRRRGMPIVIDSDSDSEEESNPPPSSSTIDLGSTESEWSEDEPLPRRRIGRSIRR